MVEKERKGKRKGERKGERKERKERKDERWYWKLERKMKEKSGGWR